MNEKVICCPEGGTCCSLACRGLRAALPYQQRPHLGPTCLSRAHMGVISKHRFPWSCIILPAKDTAPDKSRRTSMQSSSAAAGRDHNVPINVVQFHMTAAPAALLTRSFKFKRDSVRIVMMQLMFDTHSGGK